MAEIDWLGYEGVTKAYEEDRALESTSLLERRYASM